MKDKVIVSWSGGKDSMLSLYKVVHNDLMKPLGLLTTVTREYDRVTLHGVRRSLMEMQASMLRMPLDLVYIPENCSMEEYENIMRSALSKYKGKIEGFVFGDIFLEDVRKYREKMLALEGFKGYFPLWGRDTKELVLEFIKLGFKAIITSVDAEVLDSSYVGREINEEFIENLPSNVDPAGEKGEYHSFVYDGPLFEKPVPIKVGEVVERVLGGKNFRKKFYFIDLLPANR
ncbi:MAG: diphthine--ammonia ligase [Thermoprotei archaeon]